MLVPGRGFENSRLSDTEVRGDRMLRTKDARHSRDAQPFAPRRGFHKGITVDTIAHGSFGTVKLVYWTGTGYASVKDADDEDVTIEAGWYLGNTDSDVPGNTAVIVQFFDDLTWEIQNGWCEERDWELEDEEE